MIGMSISVYAYILKWEYYTEFCAYWNGENNKSIKSESDMWKR